MAEPAPVLVAGEWRPSMGTDVFETIDPRSGATLGTYPVSPWSELEACLAAVTEAQKDTTDIDAAAIDLFLDSFADRIEARGDELVATAAEETGLPSQPRLADIELPRTTNQLRQAAAAARTRAWKRPVMSPAARIASIYESLPGVVCVFGPNNFPFAFNSVAGGDFAAAVATGHPIIGKGNPGHPGTTRILAEEAYAAAAAAGLPSAFIQLVYRTSHSDGARLVSDRRVAATAYTGSRPAGLALKAAADLAGRLIYLEMSSVNPVVVLPGAWRERGPGLAAELSGSLLTASGQFCTSPGLIFVPKGTEAGELRDALKSEIAASPVAALLGGGVAAGLDAAAESWSAAGARLIAAAPVTDQIACSYPNSMMEVDGAGFLAAPDVLQAEAFGNLSLLVVCEDVGEIVACLEALEGNLTGSVYSGANGEDDAGYAAVAAALRPRVGRLLNDKVPTGVAVVPAMNHGGPYPSTGHPGFTAVGIPASLERFTMLQSYDNVRDGRLPPELQATNPLAVDRQVDGVWTADPIEWG